MKIDNWAKYHATVRVLGTDRVHHICRAGPIVFVFHRWFLGLYLFGQNVIRVGDGAIKFL